MAVVHWGVLEHVGKPLVEDIARLRKAHRHSIIVHFMLQRHNRDVIVDLTFTVKREFIDAFNVEFKTSSSCCALCDHRVIPRITEEHNAMLATRFKMKD